MAVLRKIVEIDEELCDGCGLCVPSCAEGAIQVIDGKARLVSDMYCDGLGACLGECPQDAIRVIERAADDFDPDAVEEHLDSLRRTANGHHTHHLESQTVSRHVEDEIACGCPGSAMRTFNRESSGAVEINKSTPSPSRLTHWPVQIKLIPPFAPFLKGAKLLICADCVPFAFADFHEKYVRDHVVLVGCPKLDDIEFYMEKFKAIFSEAKPAGITVLKMEVPCCNGIAMAAIEARNVSTPDIPVDIQTIGVKGSLVSKLTIK